MSSEGIYCLCCGDVLQPRANICEKCGNRTVKGRRRLFRYTIGSFGRPYPWIAAAVAVLAHLGAWLFVGDGAEKWDARRAVKLAEEQKQVEEYDAGTQWLLTHFKDTPWYTWVAHERTRRGQNSFDSLETFVEKNSDLRLTPEQAALVSAHLCWSREKDDAGEILTRLTVSKEEVEAYDTKTAWLTAKFVGTPWESWVLNERDRKTHKSDESLERFVSAAPDLKLTPEQYALLTTNLRWEDGDKAAERLKKIVNQTTKAETDAKYKAETRWLLAQFEKTPWHKFMYHERIVNRSKASDKALQEFAEANPYAEVTPELCVLVIDNLWWDSRDKAKKTLAKMLKDYDYKKGTDWILSHFEGSKWRSWMEYHRYNCRSSSSYEDLKRFLWEQDNAMSVVLSEEQAKMVHAHLWWGDNGHEAFKMLSGYVKPTKAGVRSKEYLAKVKYDPSNDPR